MKAFSFLCVCVNFQSVSLGLYKIKYGSHASYVHNIHYDMPVMYITFIMTLLCAFKFWGFAFNTTTFVSGSVMEKKNRNENVPIKNS